MARSWCRKSTFTQAEVDGLVQQWTDRLEQDFQAAKAYKPNKADWLEGAWSGLDVARGYDPRRGKTDVPAETLKEVGLALTKVPVDFKLNRKIARQLDAKRKMIETGEGIDWATAEALAFGTLLVEGHPLRLSGQDSNRGTFSQRHAAFIDQETEATYKPLSHIRDDQARLEIVDSPLSELAVLGFEYGFSLAEPRALVMWEAQFGDFVNGAQIIIDQFIASGESKWLRLSGLVMLLPHGYEGQGPEHSSARIERFLQLCGEDNLQVVNCTTPANYFHVLRRQLHREFRKPLIVFTPKSLLRHKRCVSSIEHFGPGSCFHRVLYCDDPPSEKKDAKQVVICSGKIYYDLLEEREKARPEGGPLPAARTDLSLPGGCLDAGAGALQALRPGVVSGRAAQHGTLGLRLHLHRGGGGGDRLQDARARAMPGATRRPRRRPAPTSATWPSRPP